MLGNSSSRDYNNRRKRFVNDGDDDVVVITRTEKRTWSFYFICILLIISLYLNVKHYYAEPEALALTETTTTTPAPTTTTTSTTSTTSQRPAPVAPVSAKNELSLKESLGWFNVPDDEWAYFKEVHYKTRNNQIEAPEDLPMGRSLNFDWKPTFSCPIPPLRIGYMDGGKVICDERTLQVDDCFVVSIGSNGQFEFEEWVLSVNPKCEIHTFDHTWEPDETVPKEVHYHKIGLGNKNEGNIKTMPAIIEMLGLENRHIQMFKIDCEGCEFEVYENFYKPGVLIDQLLIEVHFGMKAKNKPWQYPAFEALLQNGYVIISKEPNTYADRGHFTGTTEFTLLRFDKTVFK